MINRDTIWKETYQKQTVRPEGASASISVFTAIHHFSGMRNVSELKLCAELQVSIHEDKANHTTEIELSPEDMEDLAAYFTASAKRTRELQAMIESDKAEIEAAAAEDLRKTKEAA